MKRLRGVHELLITFPSRGMHLGPSRSPHRSRWNTASRFPIVEIRTVNFHLRHWPRLRTPDDSGRFDNAVFRGSVAHGSPDNGERMSSQWSVQFRGKYPPRSSYHSQILQNRFRSLPKLERYRVNQSCYFFFFIVLTDSSYWGHLVRDLRFIWFHVSDNELVILDIW